MRWTHMIGAVWLAEGHLRRGDYATARPLIEDLLAHAGRRAIFIMKAGHVG